MLLMTCIAAPRFRSSRRFEPPSTRSVGQLSASINLRAADRHHRKDLRLLAPTICCPSSAMSLCGRDPAGSAACSTTHVLFSSPTRPLHPSCNGHSSPATPSSPISGPTLSGFVGAGRAAASSSNLLARAPSRNPAQARVAPMTPSLHGPCRLALTRDRLRLHRCRCLRSWHDLRRPTIAPRSWTPLRPNLLVRPSCPSMRPATICPPAAATRTFCARATSQLNTAPTQHRTRVLDCKPKVSSCPVCPPASHRAATAASCSSVPRPSSLSARTVTRRACCKIPRSTRSIAACPLRRRRVPVVA